MITITKLLINGVDYSDSATIPMQTKTTLDESLDLIYVELNGIDVSTPFSPFYDVEIEIKQGGIKRSKYMFVESDTVTEVISGKFYNHAILFIEQTKWLERIFVEKSIRQPLIHDYLGTARNIEVTRTESHQLYSQTTTYISEFSKNVLEYGTQITLPSIKDWFGDLFYFDTGVSYLEIIVNGVANRYRDVEQPVTVNLDKQNIYEIIYYNNNRLIASEYWKDVFTINVVIQPQPKENYTIRDVINQLFATCITLRESETPLFSIADIDDYSNFSKEYKKRVSQILDSVSPEFTFAKMSLYEALKTIGDYAHFIPRLENKKLYLDLLGIMKNTTTGVLDDYFSNIQSQNSNEFCSKLDSQVSNLVNIDDEAQGSVTTPFNYGYRTLRTESGLAQIKDDNLIIPTENAIEKIIKLEIGYLKNGEYVGDITPYVYEDHEYKGLSSYGNTFPTSKMFALKYTEGQPNITELSFKRENVINEALEGIAIKNIIHKKLNKPINEWTNFWDNEDVFQLQYRLTYIPSTNTRVTQSKANKKDIIKSISVAYNQSASKVSSNAYGENLKGVVAKFGNIEKSKMYIFPTIDLIPKCGQWVDDEYCISAIKCEYYPNFIKCEVGFSKNYNNKSAYVEINSQLEFFEYDRNLIIDRYVVYEDYCEIGYDSETDNKSLITDRGLDMFSYAFIDGFNGMQVSLVKAEGFTKNSISLGKFVLPIISLGIGNSLLFAFRYEDSASAGNTASYVGTTRVQNFAKYVDEYGEVETLKLEYGINNQIITDYESAVAQGNAVPNVTLPFTTNYFSTENDKIVLKKGVAETPHISYQVHFVSNNDNLIIGSGLARKSTFTTEDQKNYKLYLLPTKINKFDTKIDLTFATLCPTIELTTDYDNKKIKINNFVAEGENQQWKSWAIVETYNGQNDLIIGENKIIKSGDTVTMPYFTFKHKIVEE